MGFVVVSSGSCWSLEKDWGGNNIAGAFLDCDCDSVTASLSLFAASKEASLPLSSFFLLSLMNLIAVALARALTF